MKVNGNYYQLYGAIYSLTKIIEQDVKEFEIVVDDKDLKKKGLLDIGTVYMHSIIIDLSKLFSVTQSDKIGLKHLKSISPKESQNKIEKLKSNYSDIIKKVSCNRNRIIVHHDISKKGAYYNMGISKIEIEKIINDYKTSYHYDKSIDDKNDPFILGMRKIVAQDKSNERYSLSDFKSDIPKIKEILEEIKLINNNIFGYYHKQDDKKYNQK